MTTQTSNNARRFSPIFIATITPASVSTSTAKNGNKYAVMKGATIAREGQEAKVMTAMAFGKSHTEVAKLLRKGRSVDLAVQYRSEEHTSELQSLMRISYAVFCLKNKNKQNKKLTLPNKYTSIKQSHT